MILTKWPYKSVTSLPTYSLETHKKSLPKTFLNAKKYPLKNNEDILVFCKNTHTYNPQMRVGSPYTCKKGGGTDNYNKDSKDNIITINKGGRYPLTTLHFPRDKSKLHPTQKPVALFEYLIKTYTSVGDLVLDNAAGSGPTGIAARNLNRNFILIEKEQEYIDIINKRLL